MLRSILVIGIIGFGLAASLRSRFAALLLYVWFALFRPQEWVWFDISGFRLSFVTGLALVVPSLLTGVFPNLSHPLSIGSILFLATGLVAQSSAIRPDVGWEWLDFFGRLILVCLLAVTLVNSRRRFLALMGVIAVSFGFHTAKAGLASILGGGIRYSAGLGGAFIDNNAYALAAVMIIPLLIATGQNCKQRWLRYGFYAAVPLTIMTVISLFSRGGFLALAAATMTFVAVRKHRFVSMAVVAAVVFLTIQFAPIPEGYANRLQTIQTYDEVGDASALGRLHFWRVALDMVADHPLGVGLWNYEYAYDQYDTSGGAYGTFRAVHSSHFQVLAEQGYLGALIYFLMFVLAFKAALRVRRRARGDLSPEDKVFALAASTALMASMAAFLVGGAFVAMAQNDLTWLVFALVAALDRITARSEKERTGTGVGVSQGSAPRGPVERFNLEPVGIVS